MDNSEVPPEYTLFSSEWTRHYVAELGSDREVVELPAQHGSTELYTERATTPQYFEQQPPNIPELGVTDDDSTQVSQFLAHGTYQPAELSTTTDSAFESHNDNAAQKVQVDDWDHTPSNYDTTPEDLLNMYFSNNDLPMSEAPTVDAPCQQTPQTSNTTQPLDCTEPISAVADDGNGRYPSTCDLFPMGSFTESDMNQGSSVFSASPSGSISETSVSSIYSIKTPPDNTHAPLLSFFDEPDRMCQDSIEDFESLASTKNLMNNPQASFHFFFNEPDRVYQEHIEEEFHLSEVMSMSTSQSTSSTLASPWSSGSSSTTSQSFSSSYCYFSGMLHEEL
jgi:hypothetical protein